MKQSYTKKGKAGFLNLIFLDIDFKCPHSWTHVVFFFFFIEPSRTLGGRTPLDDAQVSPSFKLRGRSSLRA